MADNGNEQKQTEITPVASMDDLRVIIRQLLSEEIATGLTPLVKRVDELTDDLASTARRLDLTRTEMKALDSAYRDTQNRYVDAVNSANQIVGTFKGVQDMLDQWIQAASANGKAIIVLQEGFSDIQRDLYGDNTRRDTKSVMGELEKIPALIGSTIKTEVRPLITRLDALQAVVDDNNKWIQKRRSMEAFAGKYFGGLVKNTGVRWAVGVAGTAILSYLGYSAATGTNLVYEFFRILGGG